MNWPLIALGVPTLALGLLTHGCSSNKPTPAQVSHVEAASGKAQARLDAGVGRAVQQSRNSATRAARTVNEAAHEIEAAPGADAPVPDAVAAPWNRTIEQLRIDAARAHADAAKGDPAAGVSGAGPAT